MTGVNTGPDSPPSSRRQPQAPAAIGRVLVWVRFLISHGKELAAGLRHAAEDRAIVEFAWLRFRSRNIPQILARLAHGLRLAALLEAHLVRRAERGLGMPARTRRYLRARPAHRATMPVPKAPRQDPEGLPTAWEIAASVRRRGAGAVVEEICRDFGLGPGLFDGNQWRELQNIIDNYGGNFGRLLQYFMHRPPLTLEEWTAAAGRPPPKWMKLVFSDPAVVLPEPVAATGTGPPLQRAAA